MMDVNVCVFKRAGRNFYEAQWRDPVTGKKKTRSTKKAKKRDAERVAAVIEAEIREGRFKKRTVVSWSEFRERYENEKLRSLADKTAGMYATTFNSVERIIDPKKLQSLDSGQISRFQAKLREEGRSESTIKSYLRHLKSALRWAKRRSILAEVPEIDMPKRVKGMKGRGITTEEFERMLAAVPRIIATPLHRERTNLILKLVRNEKNAGIAVAEMRTAIRKLNRKIRKLVGSWRHLLTGLWWSGLRLGEALDLHWSDDRLLCVDLSGRRPMFRIQAEGQKSNKYELLPMAPEFAEFLRQTPEEDRHGCVFNPEARRSGNGRLRLDTTSSIICEFGKAAGIKVAEKNGKVKYASAHDLRRAFGCRWALRVMPPILKQLMRHASIQTTMEYYVGQNAEQAADVLWDAVASVDSPGSDGVSPVIGRSV